MSQYRITFSEEQYGYIYFTATSEAEAQEMLEKVRDYELDIEDLPDVVVKVKNGQCEYDTLEEVV
jgi:hypothetical protein